MYWWGFLGTCTGLESGSCGAPCGSLGVQGAGVRVLVCGYASLPLPGVGGMAFLAWLVSVAPLALPWYVWGWGYAPAL